MRIRGTYFSTVLALATMAMATAASAGSLPSLKQVGCWNKVVVNCEAISQTDGKASCQFDGFSVCNLDHDGATSVSLDSIREALPSVTATRIIIRQLADETTATAANVQ